ncbi:hypothetical protein ACIBM8_20085 [Micromonospora aurantiaca]|uniref:hypothetical protein n=1 Tax=Micromonospora aurantiaca (nom. illeg.) TaxID=47850 RepID=UPI00378FDA74
MLAVLFAAGAPAQASAYGVSPIGSFQYSWEGVTIKVPTGCLLSHTVKGDGTRVDSENVGTDCVGPGYWWGGFCNYQFSFERYDANGKYYTATRFPVVNKCGYNLFQSLNQGAILKPGRSCAVLRVNGVERARQCHNILK